MVENVADGPDVGVMLPILISESVTPGSFLHGLGALIGFQVLELVGRVAAGGAGSTREAQSSRGDGDGEDADDDPTDPTSLHDFPRFRRSCPTTCSF